MADLSRLLYFSVSLQDLDIGARNVLLYVDGNLVFAGDLPEGSRHTSTDGSPCTTIDLTGTGQGWTPEDKSPKQDTVLVTPRLPLEDGCPGETVDSTSCADLEATFPAASGSISTETFNLACSPETAELVQSEDECSLKEQMEKLSGRKELSSKASSSILTPSCAREKSRASSAKHKPPPWLELELPVDQLLSESTRRDCLSSTRGSLQLSPSELDRSICGVVDEGTKPAMGAKKERAAGVDFLTPLFQKYSCTPEPLLPGRGKEEFSKMSSGIEDLPDKGAFILSNDLTVFPRGSGQHPQFFPLPLPLGSSTITNKPVRWLGLKEWDL